MKTILNIMKKFGVNINNKMYNEEVESQKVQGKHPKANFDEDNPQTRN